MQYFRELMQNTTDLEPSLALLKTMQEKFVHCAYYSNLDVVLGRMHSLVPQDAFNYVVRDGKGGSCRDLNLAFYHMLKSIGFEVYLTSAHVYHYNEMELHNEVSTHLILLTIVDDDTYAVDPAWGNASRYPLPLTGQTITHPMGTFRVAKAEDGKFSVDKLFDDWVLQFTFDPKVHKEYHEFQSHLEFIYSEKSMFRDTLFITKAFPDKCIALVDDKIYTTDMNGTKTVESVIEKGGLRTVLVDTFDQPKDYIETIVLEQENVKAAAKQKLLAAWLAEKPASDLKPQSSTANNAVD